MKFLGFANQQKSDSGLGCTSLLSELQAVCATFPDRRKGRGGNIAPADFGLSAFAMFFMQSASFLAYQCTMEKGHGRSNCRTLFGIGRIPSNNYIRDFLDEADPALLQPCFERMEALLSEPPMRQAFAPSTRGGIVAKILQRSISPQLRKGGAPSLGAKVNRGQRGRARREKCRP